MDIMTFPLWVKIMAALAFMVIVIYGMTEQ